MLVRALIDRQPMSQLAASPRTNPVGRTSQPGNPDVDTELSLYSAAVAPSSPDPVAVIGASGALGFGLALRLARTGVPIAIGSRDGARAQETAERARGLLPSAAFTAHENADAVRAVGATGIVILSVPFRNQAETLANLSRRSSPSSC